MGENNLLRFFKLDNFIAYMISFLLSSLVYYFYSYETNETINFSIPIEYISNESMVISKTYNKYVNISLSGQKTDIEKIKEENIRAVVNFSFVNKPGSYESKIEIEKNDISALSPISVSAQPQKVMVNIDYFKKKEVFIIPDITGYPKIGYELKQQSVNPKTIIISGAASELSLIKSISTEPINIDNKDGDFSKSVPLKYDENIKLDVYNVIVDFVISESKTDKIFKDIKIAINNLNDRFDYKIITQTEPFIKTRASKSAIENLTSKDFYLSVDASKINKEGEYVLPAYPRFPSTVNNMGYDPKQIRIKVFLRNEA